MFLLKRESVKPGARSCYFYAPIAKALSTLPDDEKDRLRKKFNVAYFMAREKLSFHKYPQICELEVKHGVDLGTMHHTEIAGR